MMVNDLLIVGLISWGVLALGGVGPLDSHDIPQQLLSQLGKKRRSGGANLLSTTGINLQWNFDQQVPENFDGESSLRWEQIWSRRLKYSKFSGMTRFLLHLPQRVWGFASFETYFADTLLHRHLRGLGPPNASFRPKK